MVEGAEFHCAAGDVACLVDAITTSNGNSDFNIIRLEAGTYSLKSVLPTITGAMTIGGDGLTPDATVIERSGPALFRIFSVEPAGILQLANVTVRFGDVGDLGLGGAIQSRGAVAIFFSIMRDNFASGGSAIDVLDGSLGIFDSRIDSNSTDLDGGIVTVGCFPCTGPSSPYEKTVTIARSSFSDNSSRRGIIGIQDGWSVQIIDSDITGNHGAGLGSALGIGGSAVPSGRPVTITGTTIAGNQGLVGLNAGKEMLISNSTIANNQGGVSGAGSLRIRNSVVSNNNIVTGSGTYADCEDLLGGPTVVSSGHNLFGDARGCGNLLATDLVGNAGLGGLVDSGRPGGRYVPLLPDSPAIDAGDSAACADLDQRGLARPIDGNGDGVRACDIGAIEFYPVVNDRVQLTALTYAFFRSPAVAYAPAGAFRITATFANQGPDVCHVAFDVVALDGAAGVNPVLTTGSPVPVGGKGAAMSATMARAQPHLRSGASEPYEFTIGVERRMPINFMVNVVGDATSGPCAP